MLPTIANEGEFILVEKLSVPMKKIQRGDVVVLTSPEDSDKLICKRVIGLVLHY